MTKQQVESVLDKIRELVPEIGELSFGCRAVFDLDYYGSEKRLIEGIYCGRSSAQGVHIIVGPEGPNDFRYFNENQIPDKILGHDIYAHHVLSALDDKGLRFSKEIAKIVRLWALCCDDEDLERGRNGLLKSLQTIIEGSGWGWKAYPLKRVERLKDPNARALLEFLGEIFLNSKS